MFKKGELKSLNKTREATEAYRNFFYNHKDGKTFINIDKETLDSFHNNYGVFVADSAMVGGVLRREETKEVRRDYFDQIEKENYGAKVKHL
jgi:hypothetical protein